MNFGEQRNNNPFTPLTIAISDTFLQMRAKPLIFFAVWFLLALPPQLLLDLAFQQLITEMAEISYQILGDIPDSDFQIAEQNSGVIKNNFRVKSALLAFLALTIYIYLYSVLGDVIARFRKKLLPRIVRSLTGGLRGYVSLSKVVLASAGRICVEPVVIMVLGGVIAGLLKQETLTYAVFAVSFIMLLINQLRYGLAPFVHLSLGIVWRSALAISRSYYRTHRLTVLALFGFVTFLPLVVFGLLANALLNLVAITRAVSIVFGVLQSIVSFFMGGVLINFGMNNFIPESSGSGIGEGDDFQQVEATSQKMPKKQRADRAFAKIAKF